MYVRPQFLTNFNNSITFYGFILTNSGVLNNRFLQKSFDFKGSSVQKQRPQNLIEILKFMKTQNLYTQILHKFYVFIHYFVCYMILPMSLKKYYKMKFKKSSKT